MFGSCSCLLCAVIFAIVSIKSFLLEAFFAEAPPPATEISDPSTAGELHIVLVAFEEENSFLNQNSRTREAAQFWPRLMTKSAQLSTSDFSSKSNEMVEHKSVSPPLTTAEICSYNENCCEVAQGFSTSRTSYQLSF